MKLFIATLVVLGLLAVPALADVSDTVDVNLTIETYLAVVGGAPVELLLDAPGQTEDEGMAEFVVSTNLTDTAWNAALINDVSPAGVKLEITSATSGTVGPGTDTIGVYVKASLTDWYTGPQPSTLAAQVELTVYE